MTTYTAPPDVSGLVLDPGDILNINEGGSATHTIINRLAVENVFSGGTATGTRIASFGEEFGEENVFSGGTATGTSIEGGVQNVNGGLANFTRIIFGGVENVLSGGTATHTTIDSGVENVFSGGLADFTTINSRGVENVDGGRATHTTIHSGGVEDVFSGGSATRTTIFSGGVENVRLGGTADVVTFHGPGARLNLDTPSGLKSTIVHWGIGDVIDFRNTNVTSVNKTGDALTVTWGNSTATYTLAQQQSNTEFKLQPDDHGGTELTLVHIVGVAPDVAGHLV